MVCIFKVSADHLDSNLAIEIIDFAMENGINHFLLFQHPSSLKMQPLGFSFSLSP